LVNKSSKSPIIRTCFGRPAHNLFGIFTFDGRCSHMAMTKSKIVDLIRADLGYSWLDAYCFVESFFEIIKDELAQGNCVLIPGFGKWSVRAKNERRGHNVWTDEAMRIRARKVVTFKCSRSLKKAEKGLSGRAS
jgi:integration host factor subunit alpha